MRLNNKTSILSAAALLAIALVPADTRAKGPHSGLQGCPVQNGMALTGAIHIAFERPLVCDDDPTNNSCADAEIVLRLRKGNGDEGLKTFFAATQVENVDDPCVVQAAVQEVMAPQIEAAFFPGEERTIGLGGASDIGVVEPMGGETFRHIIADLTVTAK